MDYPDILNETSSDSSSRVVVLGPLGVVAAVHGVSCRDTRGVAFDPTGRRVFDAPISDAITENPAIREVLHDALRRVMVGGMPVTEEYSVEDARGGGWRRLRVFARRAGPPVVIVRDISRSRAAELALHRSEALHRLATHAAAVGVWELDVETGELSLDPDLETLLGYEPGAVRRHLDAWVRLIVPADRAEFERRLREHIEGRTELFEMERRMMRRDGGESWFSARATVIESRAGQARRVLGTDVDVTRRRRAELALQAARQRYEIATRAGRISVWEIDLATNEVVVDDVLAEIIGADVADGWTLAEWLARIQPEDRERVERYGARELRPDAERDAEGHTRVPPIDYRVRHADGTFRWVSTSGRVLRAEDGRPRRVVGVTIDITERHRSEAALRASRAKLHRREREIRRLTTRLTVAQEEERQRIARELHDDVSQRVAALEILAADAGRRATGEVASATLHEMRARLGELAHDIRRLSHAMAPPAVAGQYLRHQLVSYGQELYRFRRVRVRLDIEDLPAAITNDIAVCLYRVAQESLWNVARHADVATARLQLRGEADGLHLEVGDDGRGFDPTQGGASNGFGLASMKQRVEQLGGTFEIQTAPGEGTRIRAWLPLRR